MILSFLFAKLLEVVQPQITLFPGIIINPLDPKMYFGLQNLGYEIGRKISIRRAPAEISDESVF